MACKLNTNLFNKIGGEIVAAYKSGDTIHIIAAKHKFSYAATRTYLLSQGVIPRNPSERHKKHSLNESVFDSINEESAYWVGFLMADGCVSTPKFRSKRISLGLAKRDILHIEKFKKFLGASHKINCDGNSVRFYINSNKLAESLAVYGIVPRKSFTANVFGLEFNRDFWRGAIDGDGYISGISKQRATIQFCGSKNLTEQFVAFAEAELQTKPMSVRLIKNIFSAAVYGKQAAQLARLLYEGCSVTLERKLERAKQLISLYEVSGNPIERAKELISQM